MTITFVDEVKNRKFSYDGVRRIKTYCKDVYIYGLDFATDELYSGRIEAKEYTYFIVQKEDIEDE